MERQSSPCQEQEKARHCTITTDAGDTAKFEEQLSPLRAAAPASLRFVLVTATLPQHTVEVLREAFEDITLASGPGLHRTAPGSGRS